MDRGAWRATVHGVVKVRHDLVTKLLATIWNPLVMMVSLKSPVIWSTSPPSCNPFFNRRKPRLEKGKAWSESHNGKI